MPQGKTANTPNPTTDQSPSNRRPPTRSARASQKLRRQAAKQRKTILHQRVLSHLQQVEEANRKKGCNLRRSLRLHLKECNEGFPPDKPLYKAVLFGEEEYFLDRDEKEGGPPDGYRLLVWRSKGSRHEESDRSYDSDTSQASEANSINSLAPSSHGIDDTDNPSLDSHQGESDYTFDD